MLHRKVSVCFLALLITVIPMVQGCAAGDAVINILNIMEPAVEGVLPIVALADPALAPAIQTGIILFDGGVTAVTAAYHAYESAVTNADGTAPTRKQELLAALAALKQSGASLLAAAQVKDAQMLALIQDIMNAVIAEVTQIVNIISPSSMMGAARSATLSQLKAEQKAFKSKMHGIYSRQTGNAALDAQLAKTAKKV